MPLRRQRVVRAGGAALVILLPLCCNPLAAEPFEPAKVTLFLDTTLALALLSLVGIGLERKARSPLAVLRSPRAWGGALALPTLLYAATLALATAIAPDPGRSLWGTPDQPRGLMTLLGLIAFFALVADALRTRGQSEHLVTAALLGSVPVVTYGLAQFLGLDPLPWLSDSLSPVLSTLGRSNFLGAYLAMLIPLTLSRVVGARGSPWLWRYAIVLGLQVLCLWLTLARGAWLGFLGGSLVFLGLLAGRWRQRALGVACILLLLLGGGLYPAMSALPTLRQAHTGVAHGMPGPGVPLADIREASVGARLAIWRGTLHLVGERWLLGYGPGTFAEIFAAHRPADLAHYQGPDVVVAHPHNLLLDQLASAGVAGLAAFLAVVAAFYRVALGAFRQVSDRPAQATTAALLGSGTAFLIQAQFNPDVIVLSFFFWLVLALAVAAARWAQAGQHAACQEPPHSTRGSRLEG